MRASFGHPHWSWRPEATQQSGKMLQGRWPTTESYTTSMKLEIEDETLQRTHKTHHEKKENQCLASSTSHSLCVLLSIHCLRPECSLQYMLCDKQQNCFKLFSYKVRTVLRFLSAGCWRDMAGGRGWPTVFTKNQGWEVWVWGHLVALPQPWAQNAAALWPCRLPRL